MKIGPGPGSRSGSLSRTGSGSGSGTALVLALGLGLGRKKKCDNSNFDHMVVEGTWRSGGNHAMHFTFSVITYHSSKCTQLMRVQSESRSEK